MRRLLGFCFKVCTTFSFQVFDAGGWLLGKLQIELMKQELDFFFRLGVAGKNQDSSVGGRQMTINHLHGFEFFEDRAGDPQFDSRGG